MYKSFMQRVLHYKREQKHFLFMEKQGIPLYATYYFSGVEKVFYLLGTAAVVAFLAFFFYRSVWAVLFLWPVGIWMYLALQKEKGRKRQRRLEVEFQDCMYALVTNLRAGYSVEHAFMEVLPDMEALNNNLIVKELLQMKKGLANNVMPENQLLELGRRSDSTNIREFSEVFTIARTSGGNLPAVLTATAELIGQKMTLQQQLQVVISGRKLEQNIMCVIPFLLVCYIDVTNKGFFDVLYQDWFGRLIMTACLSVYLTAFFWAQRICAIGR